MGYFEKCYEMGENGEKIFTEIIIKHEKVWVIPIFQYGICEKSPRVYSENKQYTMPDLQIFSNNKMKFADVKTKESWVHWKGVIQTGFEKKHYEDYIRIAKKCNTSCHVFFIQKNKKNHNNKIYDSGVYYVDITKNPYDREWESQGIVYWYYDHLKKYKHSQEIMEKINENSHY